MDEAPLTETESGLVPAGEGWFVVNVRDAEWWTSKTFGSGTVFETKGFPFRQLGINIAVMQPGEPNCLYHSESLQEDFLVLSGECKLLVEGEERLLRAWDFVHCPPGAAHVVDVESPDAVAAAGGFVEELAHRDERHSVFS